MAEYKDTLNLPDTTFPMKANLSQREPQKLADWQGQDLYLKIRAQHQGKKSFVMHDGPPYANGHLHCGHALNKILKDIIVKSKTLSGFDAPFVPGWDCHGLPIELNVEKKVGKAGTKISAKAFRAKCREYAASQIDIQREEFQRLGVFGNWEQPYATYDFSYEANIIRALGKIIENGHLQQGFKPVHWCIDCGSALAEAEVDYEEKTSPSIDVAFYANDAQSMLAVFGSFALKPVIVPIWTTTPWSLPANEAVCLHPEFSYDLIDAGDNYLLIATALVETVMQRYGINEYQSLAQVKGQHLVHHLLRHPYEERLVPVILGEHVTTDSGTGSVHTAPAHGPEDYQVGKLFNLPLHNPVKANGCYASDVPFVAGLSVLKANDTLVNMLKEKGTLLHLESIRHSYPHCWRHKTPMIFLATPQWFIAMDKNGLRQSILKVIEDVEWVPEWGKSRIYSMVETRPDWCISRQRAWGTPMTLFIHKETRELHPQTQSLIEKIAGFIEEEGIDAWFDRDVAEWLGADDAEHYDKVTDTLDVWFDSGVSHYCVLQKALQSSFPADVYFEGSDQHRGWFNSSLTTAVAMYGEAPYKTVLTHGYTVDAEGKKLSKSKGNYVSLDKLINQHGADILRLWVSSTDYRNEVSISDEIIKRNADAYRRIRNTARFLLANLFDFNPEEHLLPVDELVELDAWALKRCQLLQEEIIEAYENYHFHAIYQKIHNFCAVDLGSFYLDVIKDRQYTTPTNSLARRSCQTAMYHILQAVTRWLAPILSFTAEEIWQFIPGQQLESVFLSTWYDSWPAVTTIDLTFWQQMQAVRDEVNKALELKRQQGVIGSGLAARVTIYANPVLHNALLRLSNELRFVLITSDADVKAFADRTADAIVSADLELAIEVHASDNAKCARCWHRRETVGTFEQFPELCDRCVNNLNGQDEVRYFA